MRNATLFAAIAVSASMTGIAQSLPPCFVDLPVYDAKGAALKVSVLSVSIDELPGVDLLSPAKAKHKAFRVVVRGSRVYYPQLLVFKWPLRITLAETNPSARRETIRATVPMFDCHQRFSVQHGIVDTNSDVGPTRIEGRILGCEGSRELWVRATPMFGGQEMLRQTIFDGYLDPVTKSFRIQAPMRGERHLVVFGSGRDPLKALGVDVTSGKVATNVGTIDLRSVCPKT